MAAPAALMFFLLVHSGRWGHHSTRHTSPCAILGIYTKLLRAQCLTRAQSLGVETLILWVCMFTQNDDVVLKSYEKTMPAFSSVFLQWHADGQKLATKAVELRNQAFSWLRTQLVRKHTAAVQMPTTLPVEPVQLRHLQLLLQLLAGHECSSELDPKSCKIALQRVSHKYYVWLSEETCAVGRQS